MPTLASADDVAAVVRRLRNVRPETQAKWGRMSAHQMICHCGDAFRMAIGERLVTPVGGPLQRTVLKWIALYAPLRWPPGIRTVPEVDQEAGGTRPMDFADDVARLESLLQRFVTSEMTDRPPHPVFGRMSNKAWLRWGYLHTDHHLRQFGA
jgi:hypothetical protein